jgi:phospholipase/lecithinase/hemolysin
MGARTRKVQKKLLKSPKIRKFINLSLMKIALLFKTVAGTAIALTTLSTLPVKAALPDYDQIFVFGDSLSDPGNDFAVSGFPPAPYDKRFSNGRVWVEYLAEDLGLNPTPYTALPANSSIPDDGINFAFGGATTGHGNIGNPPFPFIGLTQQIDAFVDLYQGQPADEEDLYILWAGSNDYFATLLNPVAPTSEQVEAIVKNTVGNLSAAIEELTNAGARNILVVNQPDLGNTPFIRGLGDQAVQLFSGAITLHNALLAQELQILSNNYSQSDLISFDINALFNEILIDPEKFGFTNVVTPCTNSNFYSNPPTIDPNVCDNPQATLFWDNTHPTTSVHRIIANTALKKISVPEPATVPALGLLGLGYFLVTARKKAR